MHASDSNNYLINAAKLQLCVHKQNSRSIGYVHGIICTTNVPKKHVIINDASRVPKPRLLSCVMLVLKISQETPSSLIMVVQMDSEDENNTFWHTVAEIFY